MNENKGLIGRHIKALSSHYPSSAKSPADEAQWLLDYADDLAQHSAETIGRACAAWRKSPENKRMPTPGQLLALAEKHQDRAQAIAGPKPEVWTHLSEASYNALDLPEKIRHRRILADEAKSNAARLWRKLPETIAGKPPSFNDWDAHLPAEWAIWRQREVGHRAEAATLKTFLKDPRDRAA